MLPIYATIFPLITEKFEQGNERIFAFEDFYKMGESETSLATVSFVGQMQKWNTAEDVSPASEDIEAAERMEVLELKGNTLGVEASKRLATAIGKHPELKRCLWSDLFTGRLKTEIPPILKTLCRSMMACNTQLVELDLSDNAFGPIGAEGIQDFLVSRSAFSLQVLKLNNNGLGAGGKIVAHALSRCHDNARLVGRRFQLKTFVAGRNRLEEPGARALAAAFVKIRTLEEIIVPQNGIPAGGICALARAFEANPNLRVINLNDNTCTERGALAVAEGIVKLTKLEVLDLGDCLCRDDGGIAIVSMLVEGDYPNLKMVDLSGNELTPETAFFALVGWKEMTASLKLSTNNFGSAFTDVKEEIEDANAPIDIGAESDDEGTLDGEEDAEYHGDEEYDEEQDEENDEEYEEEQEHEGVGDNEEEQVSEQMEKAGGDSDVDALLSGVGCMKMSTPALPTATVSPYSNVTDADATLSFLDQQHKWNTREDAEEAAIKIESQRVLRTLELRGNTLGTEAGQRIGEALMIRTELQRCLWSDLFTGRLKTEIPRILRSLCNAVMFSNAQIVELDLSDNAFGPIGAEGIEDFLMSPSAYSLEVLKLNNNGLGAGGKVIARALLECHKRSSAAGRPLQLKTFVAGRNRLEVPGATALAEAFKAIGTLEEVTMHQNGITAKGVIALAEAFEVNRSLRVLNIQDNTATELGSKAIAKALPNLTRLEVLNLGDCLCRDAGCHAIVDALNPFFHQKLKEVVLSGAELTAEAARLVAGKFQKFSGRATLKIDSNNFGHQFGDLRSSLPEYVDIGESDDDQGTLSDAEEYQSGASSEEEAESEEEQEKEESNRPEVDHRDENVLGSAFHLAIASMEKLSEEYESRTQEETATFMLKLIEVIAHHRADKQIVERAIDLAENVVSCVEAAKRRPIPPSTQLINQLIAQAGFIESETKFSASPVDRDAFKLLINGLLDRGCFQREEQTIDFYFNNVKLPKPAPAAPAKNPFSFNWNFNK